MTAFMAALPQNVIPTDIDPTEPIDPQLVLDFDTRSPRAGEEVDNVVSDVWLRNPVVVFSKVKCLSHCDLSLGAHGRAFFNFFSFLTCGIVFFFFRRRFHPYHVSSSLFWMV